VASGIEQLRQVVASPVVLPDDDGWDDARRSFNAMIDRQPVGIVQPETAADVAASIRFARARDLPIGVRGGGHSVAGHGLVDDGLVIDLRRMRGVDVDPFKRRATAAGGATWLDVDTASQAHGLAVTGGTFVDTGIGGLTLGGGFGFLMGTCGLTCDNLVGAQLATADGRLIDVSPETDAELLWALRGGGGNFGIVTRFDYRLHQVGRMFGGEVVVPLDDGAVLRRYAEAQVWAPDGLVVMCVAANSLEFGPAVSLQFAWLGTPEKGEELADSIFADAEILAGSLGTTTYAEIQALSGIMPFTLRHYWKSAFVADLSAPVVDEIVELVRSRPTGLSSVLIEPIHGQARRFGFDHSPFPERNSRFHVSGLGIWEDPRRDDGEISWVRYLNQRMRALGVGGTYVNYTAPDEPPDRARSVYPPAVYDRLRRIKRRLDPANVFSSNINIPPA
jgi:FAD/FMN-containing dehydrogenase